MLVSHPRYWLKNAHIPLCLIKDNLHLFSDTTRENLCLCDIEISQGKITQIIPACENTIGIDLKKGIVLPCFVDIHTHLDKGHIWERSPNLQGDFQTALATVREDSQRWNEEDLYRRMNFGLQCSYSQGTIALRTHLDCHDNQANISLKVWQQLRQEWQGKISLQVVPLVSLDYFLTPEGEKLADKIAEMGGVLGGVAYMNPEIDTQIEKVFELAKERNLALDFHADESGEVESICLQKIAETALKTNFNQDILCGHCCSLAVQSPEKADEIIKLVKEANIAVVSLPMCNLYLQDREAGKTPFWRGVTRVKELKQAGVRVAFASDNCRDPFFAFGDHDLLEVFRESVRIAHLDTLYEDWIASVLEIPANLMNLPHLGKIALQSPADLIIFPARYFSELLSRTRFSQGFGHEMAQCNRILIRNGKIEKNSLPKYIDF
ncbi:cytosine deaminase [Cyanobacterium aponinum]|uniref:Cytosine deaminase n=1 Tax=Cyanobacterium aponinum 0216 TaxID=2676140 RepID=A0A844GUI7_9CHRO|nr:cytosine deaminase [Cyanobacterium aponinum]MTF39213.1 cytosine deaminase [Cyanobacterium aponinum 0216]